MPVHSRSIILLLVIPLLLSACDTRPTPAEDHLDREGPAMRSDTLVQVLAAMMDSIQHTPLTGDRDVDNVQEMILHHKAMLEMNAIVIAGSENDKLKDFALRSNEQLEQEIGKMERFLERHPEVTGRGRRGRPDLLHELPHFVPTDDLDAAYVTLMRMQLNDGIELAREQSERGLHADMRELALDMAHSSERLLDELTSIGYR